MSAEMLDAAMAYASRGWPVFPCGPGAKTPIVPHGCLDATTDAGVIARWWAGVPAANVAIATGAPGPDVVDFDTKHGAPGRATYERLRQAALLNGAFMLVLTPSGGWHLYYRGTAQRNGALGRHGVDFRGAGGYVLAPPSVVGGVAYTVDARRETRGKTVDWTAIGALLNPPPLLPRSRPVDGRTNHSGLLRRMAQAVKGERNCVLFWAACQAAKSGTDEAVFDELIAAAISTGMSEGEARRTVASARRTIGART